MGNIRKIILVVLLISVSFHIAFAKPHEKNIDKYAKIALDRGVKYLIKTQLDENQWRVNDK